MIVYLQMIETDEDKSKFEEIYQEYRNLMYYVSYKRMQHEQDAEDVVHHVFVKIAMLEIVDMFQPVVRKYSRMMNHDEDIASELVLALIELVHNIRLDKLDAPNDYVLISYIGRSLYHKYIYVFQKRCAVVNCEASYEDDAELERASYRNTVITDEEQLNEKYSDVQHYYTYTDFVNKNKSMASHFQQLIYRGLYLEPVQWTIG